MKKGMLILTIACCMAKGIAQPAGRLYGYVYEQNSGRKPVSGVLIKALLANQVASNNKGSYNLSFQDAQPGVPVRLTVQKETWIVTSERGLDVNLPEDPLHHPHNIVMCREAVWKQQNQTNRSILNNYLQQSYQKKLAGLNKQNAHYQKELDSLQDLYTRQQKELATFSETMSRTNLDDVSEKEKQAYQLFQQGNIEACRALRESMKSEQNFLQIQQKQKQVDSTRQDANQARESNAAISTLHRRNLREESRIAQIQLDYKKANAKLEFLASNDSTDFESLFEYGSFLIGQNFYAKAITYLKKAQSAATNSLDRNTALTSLASAYGLNFENEAAKAAFQQAIYTATKLAIDSAVIYQAHLGNVLCWSSSFYFRIYMNDSARLLQQKALAIMKPLARSNPQTYQLDLLGLENETALLLYRKGNYKEAGPLYLELLSTLQQETYITERQRKAFVAGICQNLGMLYYKSENYAAARQYFLQALSARKQIQLENPARYNQQVVQTLVTTSDLYAAMDKIDSAEYYLRAAITENHAISDANFYKNYQDADLEIRLLQLQVDNSADRNEKVKLLKTIVEKRKMLVKQYKSKYTDPLADELGNYAWELLLSRQYAAAEQAAQEGLQLAATPQLKPTKSIEWLNTCLAPALLLQGQYTEAEKIYLSLKDKPDVLKTDGTQYKTGFLSDLEEIEKAGIQHPDIAKIRALLNQP